MEDLGDLFRDWLKSTEGSKNKTEEIQKINSQLESLQTHLENEIKLQIKKEQDEENQVKQRLQRLKSGPSGDADTKLRGSSLTDIFNTAFQKRTNATEALKEKGTEEIDHCLSKTKSEFLNQILKKAVEFCEKKSKIQLTEWTKCVMLDENSKELNKDHFREMQQALSEHTVPQLCKQFDLWDELKKENVYEISYEVYETKELREYRHACVELAWEMAIQNQEHKLIWEVADCDNFTKSQLFYFDSKQNHGDELRVFKPALVCKSVLKQGLVNVLKKNEKQGVLVTKDLS